MTNKKMNVSEFLMLIGINSDHIDLKFIGLTVDPVQNIPLEKIDVSPYDNEGYGERYVNEDYDEAYDEETGEELLLSTVCLQFSDILFSEYVYCEVEPYEVKIYFRLD